MAPIPRDSVQIDTASLTVEVIVADIVGAAAADATDSTAALAAEDSTAVDAGVVAVAAAANSYTAVTPATKGVAVDIYINRC